MVQNHSKVKHWFQKSFDIPMVLGLCPDTNERRILAALPLSVSDTLPSVAGVEVEEAGLDVVVELLQ